MSGFFRPRRFVVVVAALAAIPGLLAGCSQDSSGHDPADGSVQSPVRDLTRRSDTWAPADSATLTPGVQTYTDGSGQCTTNFVFTDSDGTVYLGQAAHCASTGESDETDGCEAGALPLGTTVTFNRGGSPIGPGEVIGSGTLVYSSWGTMQERDETNASVCAYNDFALIEVAHEYRDMVNPSVPFWGGPVGIDQDGLVGGEEVHSYGNSSLRGGISQFSPQTGQADADDPSTDGWSHLLHAPTPGIPGDSGSGYLNGEGYAIGTLSTLGFTLPVSNSVGDLAKELAYARKHSGIDGLAMELGTEPFAG